MVSELQEGGSSEVSWTRERKERQDDERDHGKLLALEDPGRLEAGPPGPRVGLDMALGHDKQGAMAFVLSPGRERVWGWSREGVAKAALP